MKGYNHAFKKDYRKERKAGKPQRQAVAIALSKCRESKKEMTYKYFWVTCAIEIMTVPTYDCSLFYKLLIASWVLIACMCSYTSYIQAKLLKELDYQS